MVQPLCQIAHQEVNVLMVLWPELTLLGFTLNQGGADGRRVSMLYPGYISNSNGSTWLH